MPWLFCIFSKIDQMIQLPGFFTHHKLISNVIRPMCSIEVMDNKSLIIHLFLIFSFPSSMCNIISNIILPTRLQHVNTIEFSSIWLNIK